MWRFLRRKSDSRDQQPDPTGNGPSDSQSAPQPTRDPNPDASAGTQARPGEADGATAEHPHSPVQRTAGQATALHAHHDDAPVNFTVDPRGERDAGTAPEQDEDDLPVEPREHRPLSREDLVADARDAWTQAITGGTCAPSFLTHMRSGQHILDLTHSHPSGLAQLHAGRGATRLSSLVREVGALADARAHARVIREMAERYADDAGLATCHLGIGEASWDPLDGSAPIHAPVLIRPITLRLRGNAREDVDLDLDATAEINPMLLRSLRDAGVAVDARALLSTAAGPHGFDPTPVLQAFRDLGEPLPGFRVDHALVVGNLVDAEGAVANDLAEAPEDWAAHPVVAALAGHEQSREQLAAQREVTVDPFAVPEEELVAAVDTEHRAALAQVLAGHHLAAAVPPGTDGLDLVVDLAAELNARGRSVLIVSQRRRSLNRLMSLIAERGIEDLVFDLTPEPGLQRKAAQAMLRSLRGAGTYALAAASPLQEEDPELAESREILTGHVEAMHRVQQPWGVCAHEAISALAALIRRSPAPATKVRLRPEVARAMIGEDRARVVAQLEEAADAGVLSVGPEHSAWFGAPISSTTQADRARDLVQELRADLLPRLQRAQRTTGEAIGLRTVKTVVELEKRLALLRDVSSVLTAFHSSVFRADLAELVAATADKQWRLEHGITMGWGQRRRLTKQAMLLRRHAGSTGDLHDALVHVRGVLAGWRRDAVDATSLPVVPEQIGAARRTLEDTQRALDELAVLLDGTAAGADLPRTDIEEIGRRLHALHADQDDLENLPRRTTLRRTLEFDGLGELVEDLRERRVPRSDVGAELELSWWSTVLELIAGAEPTISQYDGTSLSQVAERFRRLDVQDLRSAADDVHLACDEVLVTTMKRYPDTSRAAIAEMARSSTVSVRDLAAKYEDILFRARPTWLASPYLVPQVLPRGRHFDAVIVADGGRLPTAAALPSIVRAKQVVVVGDPLEYGGEAPSLMDDLAGIIPVVEVLRDTHPAGEGLRQFAQRRALTGTVRAMPGPEPLDPDRLVLVENGTGPVVEGADTVESTEAELRRVTDLVIEHARTRPERSLAVVTLTPEHARRVMERIMQTVSVIAPLRSFFDPEAEEFFTVVPALHAGALRRDEVIVSIGFGKTPHGRVLHRFGPLSGPNGRKALATAITRARGRTTVVSALSLEDLDPARLRTEGAQDLRALLWVLRGGADGEVVAHMQRLTAGAPEDAGEDPTTQDAEARSQDKAGQADVKETAAPDSEAASDAQTEEAELSEEEMEAAIAAALQRRTAQADETASNEDPVDLDDDLPVTEQSVDDLPSEKQSEKGSEEEPEGDSEELAEQEASEQETQDDAQAAPALSTQLDPDALVHDLADRLRNLGMLVEQDFGLDEERIELALGHPNLPGRFLLAVDTDGERYVSTPSQRERDRLRAERLEAVGWATERVWSWALFIDPDGEAERIRRSLDRALMLVEEDMAAGSHSGAGTIRHRLPRPQIPAGHPLSFYSSEDFDAVVEYICSDGRARLEDQLATEVRSFLGFEKRSVLLDVSVSSAIRRYQERQ